MAGSEGIAATMTTEVTGKVTGVGVARERVNEKELERIYTEHVGMVYNLCYRMLHNRSDAQDATQEVFVKVYKNLSRFSGRSKLSTWVYRITMNHCIDRTRRKKLKTVPLPQTLPSPKRKDPERKLALEKAIAQLPPSYRRVFVLHDVEGFRHAEIAEILNITAGSSKSLLHRSRSILREKLQDVWRSHG